MTNICLPKEHCIVLLIGFFLITLFYIYSLNKNKFELDLKSIITSNNKVKPPYDPYLEKRMFLKKRDINALDDNFSPPERRDQEYAYPDRYVKSIINIPSRGLPDNYHTIGVLVRKNDEKVLQLFGRQKYPGSNQWEYYVSGMDGNGFPNKIPLKVKGDVEITNSQNIDVDWLDKSKGSFEVQLYNYDVPRYNPFN